MRVGNSNQLEVATGQIPEDESEIDCYADDDVLSLQNSLQKTGVYDGVFAYI